MSIILLIEDNQEIRENLSDMLKIKGFEIMEAKNAEEGLILIEKKIPDLILSDIMMPKINGFEFLSIIKGRPETSKIPFLFVSAINDKTEIKKASELGANGYITKPFTLSNLLTKIEALL
jgi:CheY-like chemotaxis protein